MEHIQDHTPLCPEILVYGETGKQVPEGVLPCGGVLELVIEPISSSSIRPTLDALQNRVQIERYLNMITGEVSFHNPLEQRLLCSCDGQSFARLFGPQFRLLLIGAGQVSSHLAEMALGLEFEVVVCEPRSEYAELWQVYGAVLDREMPDDAVKAHMHDQYCAIVALTHDPKLDDMVLLEALTSTAFYVGVLGASRTNAKRRERLSFLGITDEQIERLHGPVGLDIGSRTPAEIAISI